MKIFAIVVVLAAQGAQASAPVITKVDPEKLETVGGKITLTGSGFASDATVKVGNYPCSDVVVKSATELSCVAPINIARKADITLRNADGGTATATEALAYEGTPGFALLQQRVFQRFGVNSQGVTVVLKCTGCHGGAKPDGDLDMKDYAQVALRLVAGDPNASVLYQQIRDGVMPPKERQPPLKAEELQAVLDWIADGAQNN